jgi:hypothetical protein
MNAATTIDQGIALTEQRDALVAKLEARWIWLRDNPTHPKHDERQRAALADLTAYEAMEDRLREAAKNLVGGKTA